VTARNDVRLTSVLPRAASRRGVCERIRFAARIERSEIRERRCECRNSAPDFAALNPGYGREINQVM
jgi:hypothetical protein